MAQETPNPYGTHRERILAFKAEMPFQLSTFIRCIEETCLLTQSLSIKHVRHKGVGHSVVVSVPSLVNAVMTPIIMIPKFGDSFYDLIRDEFKERAHLDMENNTDPQDGQYIPLVGYRSNVHVDPISRCIDMKISLTTATTSDEEIRAVLDDLNHRKAGRA